MVDLDETVRPWFEGLFSDPHALDLVDAHTHIGAHDPDGFRQSAEELSEQLRSARARAVVFPMHEPGGYSAANDMTIAAARDSDGLLYPFCRVDPHANPVTEAQRCLAAGAYGVKLHPRAEKFSLAMPSVAELIALLNENRTPVLIHAGRGIPTLGHDVLSLAHRFAETPFILAHCAISDLAWIWRRLPDYPNIFVDTSWWHPADVLFVCARIAPGQILWGSDSPYGRPLASLAALSRCALQAGVEQDQLSMMLGGQLLRLLRREPAAELGPFPVKDHTGIDLVLERIIAYLTAAVGQLLRGGRPEESVALARLSCAVEDDDPYAEICSAILCLLDMYKEMGSAEDVNRPVPLSSRLLVFALMLARTPDVALPKGFVTPEPMREHERG